MAALIINLLGAEGFIARACLLRITRKCASSPAVVAAKLFRSWLVMPPCFYFWFVTVLALHVGSGPLQQNFSTYTWVRLFADISNAWALRYKVWQCSMSSCSSSQTRNRQAI